MHFWIRRCVALVPAPLPSHTPPEMPKLRASGQGSKEGHTCITARCVACTPHHTRRNQSQRQQQALLVPSTSGSRSPHLVSADLEAGFASPVARTQDSLRPAADRATASSCRLRSGAHSPPTHTHTHQSGPGLRNARAKYRNRHIQQPPDGCGRRCVRLAAPLAVQRPCRCRLQVRRRWRRCAERGR